MFCAYGSEVFTGARGEPCKLYYGANNDTTGHPKDTDVYQWRGRNGRIVTFVGRKDDGVPWWFGHLNGRRASGFDLNREHHIFASEDGNLEFESWIVGWKRGNY
jgi:hypothetical protein